MRKKIKKLIALIFVASILVTSYPIISGQFVKADPISVGIGMEEFLRNFWSLGGSFGLNPKRDKPNLGFPSAKDLMKSFGESFNTWAALHDWTSGREKTWHDALQEGSQEFTRDMALSFSQFLADLKSGTYDDRLVVDVAGSSYNELMNNLVSSKSLAYKVDSVTELHSVQLDSGMVRVPTIGVDNGRNYSLQSFINSSQSRNSSFVINRGFYIEDERSTYPIINFFAIPSNTGYFYFYDSNSKTFTYYGDTLIMSNCKYNADTNQTFQYNPTTQAIRNKSLQLFPDINVIRVIQMTNACIQMYTDGSFILRDTNDMTKEVFDIVQGGLWNQIANTGTDISDWTLADEYGVTVENSDSKVLENIYSHMLTAEDLKALENGDTSVLEKLTGLTAVNSKTGETVGTMAEEVEGQTGIISRIKATCKTIASRILTLINTVKGLVKSKWTTVVDNVGSITSPIVNGLTSVKDGIVEKVQSVVDGVTNVVDAVMSVPSTISDSFAGFFVPTSADMNTINTRANNLLKNHFGVSGSDLNFNIQVRKFDTIYLDKVKTKKVVDGKTLNDGIDVIRPFVQALMWFFMVLFAVNQVLEIFDKKGVASGDSE